MATIQGKIALVTGGGRGIGRATALKLVRQGADVAITARGAKDLNEAAAAARAQGRRVLPVPVDLADAEVAEVARGLVATVKRELGPIAILVNNAGMVGRSA